MGNNLKKLREASSISQDELAGRMGTSRSQYVKLERGERRLTTDWIERFARALHIKPETVIAEKRMVPVVGYVGAGAAALLYAEGQGPFDEVPAPEGSTDKTVSVEVRGSSLGELFDTWLVYYDDVRDPPGGNQIGKLCVCGLADGRILVKKLKRGQIAGHFTLLSNTEPPIYDVLVDWAAVVTNMTPR